MKTNSISYVAMMALLGFFFTVSMQNVQSQIIKKPVQKSEPGYPVQTKIFKPDIVLSDFKINWSAGQMQGMYNTAPFSVNVRNAGLLKTAVPFYVALQYSTPANPAFRGENTGDNCFKVATLLASNQVYLLGGMLKIISSNMAGQTIKFRAIADFDCLNEFPVPNGKIDEALENNNFSNEVSYSSGYLPNLDKVSPELCIKGVTKCILSGTGLVPQDNKYILVIEQNGFKTPIESNSWTTFSIKFTVPAGVTVGSNRIYIAEKGTLSKVSDAVEFKVGELSQVPWTDILNPLEVVSPIFSLRLHNWNGNSDPENHSEFIYPADSKVINVSKRVIEIPPIELSNWAGYYRFMFNDMSSANFGFVFSKTNCSGKQFRLNINFESDGKEIIGYYKVKGPAGSWRREGAPDIHIDNGNLDNLFTLYYNNGTINYNAATTFNAEVKAANNVEDAFLDFFKSSWNDDIRAQIAYEMQKALNSNEIRSMITGMLMDGIRNRIPDGRTIAKIDFTDNAILVTNY